MARGAPIMGRRGATSVSAAAAWCSADGDAVGTRLAV